MNEAIAIIKGFLDYAASASFDTLFNWIWRLIILILLVHILGAITEQNEWLKSVDEVDEIGNN
jgi:hypothetical protein